MPDRAKAGAIREHGSPLFLSPREVQTLSLVAQGYSDAEIGQQLYLGCRTVERYLQNAYSKLGARNRPHAVAIALARQLIPFDAVLAS